RRVVRRGNGRVRRPQRRRSRARAARASPRVEARRPAGDPRDHTAARPAEAVLLTLVRSGRAAAWQGLAGRLGLHLSACVGEALPTGGRARVAAARIRLRRRELSPAGRLDRRAALRSRRRVMTTLAHVHATPGLSGYMDEVETALVRAVSLQPGLAREVAGEALSAGGK